MINWFRRILKWFLRSVDFDVDFKDGLFTVGINLGGFQLISFKYDVVEKKVLK